MLTNSNSKQEREAEGIILRETYSSQVVSRDLLRSVCMNLPTKSDVGKSSFHEQWYLNSMRMDCYDLSKQSAIFQLYRNHFRFFNANNCIFRWYVLSIWLHKFQELREIQVYVFTSMKRRLVRLVVGKCPTNNSVRSQLLRWLFISIERKIEILRPDLA